MTFVQLKQSHLTGLTAIDAQHAEMTERLNRLYQQRAEGHGHDVLLMTFDSLIDITRNHFRYEERLLENHGYGELEAHRAEHAALLLQAEELRARLGNGTLEFSSHVMALLKDWLINHILEEDGNYVAHLMQERPSPA